MGLGLKKHILALAGRHIASLAYLLCVACVGMVVLLPVCFSRGTYFSETALGVGSAASPFSGGDAEWAAHQQRRLDSMRERGTVAEYVQEVLTRTATASTTAFADSTLVTAVIPSQRGTHSSGFLLACGCDDSASLALVLRAVEVWGGAPYLGMDLHVVAVDGNIKEGLSQYGVMLRSGKVPGVGAIKAGVFLDLGATGFDFETLHIQTLAHGAVGVLQPNMDLANTVYRLCMIYRLPCSMLDPNVVSEVVHTPPHWVEGLAEAAVSWKLPNLRTTKAAKLAQNVMYFWSFVAASLTEVGLHGDLRDSGVHMVTLEGVGGVVSGRGDRGLVLLNVVNGVLRAMNNMCERLHQSFWVYYYTNDEHFVDYDTAQQPAWLGIAAIICASLATPLPQTVCVPAKIAAVVTTEALLALLLATQDTPYAVLLLIAPLLLVFTLKLSVADAAMLKAVSTLYGVCFLASCTVLSCSLGFVGAVYVAVVSCIALKADGRAPLRSLLTLTLGVGVWAAVCLFGTETPLGTLTRVFFYSVALPHAGICAAGSIVGYAAAKKKVE